MAPLAEHAMRSRLIQTTRFLPRGLRGIGYWYAVLPLHGFVFGRMLRGICRATEAVAGARKTSGL